MNRALVVVDVQNDFVDGALGSKEAQAIIPKVVEKIKFAAEKGDIIAVTQDEHSPEYLQTFEGKYLPIEHCIEGTKGSDLNFDIYCALPVEAIRVYKGTFGSFYLTDVLVDMMPAAGYDEIEICGLCTDICVMANAVLLRTQFPNTKIVVDASACAGSTPENHAAALQVMKCLQIDVVE